MKSKLLLSILLVIFLLVGCSKNNKNSIVSNFDSKVKAMDSYKIDGVLTISNNELNSNSFIKYSLSYKLPVNP